MRFGIILTAIYLVFKFFLLPTVTSPQFEIFTESLGIFGYLVIIGYVVVSHVFAPVAGTPGVALGITIYGINTGMWLLYIGSLISASISFVISKHFGRPWVLKLAGKQSITKIDEFAAVEGKQIMIISRLFGFALFDFISYAAGLTKIKYRDYILITAIFGLIPNLIFQFTFRNIDFRSEFGILIWMGSIGLVGIIFSVIIKHYLKKHNNLENRSS